MKPFTIAHISDLHFSQLTLSLSQFFSKRWIGNLNLLFSRKSVYTPDFLAQLPSLFQDLEVDLVAITGDVSTTSLPQEFTLAKDFVDTLHDKKMRTLILPGNHDQYTKKSYQSQEFYQYFPQKQLQKQRVALEPLHDKWGALLIDTACATNWFSSKGHFKKEIEETLQKTLEQIPEESSIIVMNHFPLFQNDSKRKELKGARALQELLQKHFSKVKLYLNGHTHRHCIADLRANHYPVVLDSGSASHKTKGTWNLIRIEESQVTVEPYAIVQGNWQPFAPSSSFSW